MTKVISSIFARKCHLLTPFAVYNILYTILRMLFAPGIFSVWKFKGKVNETHNENKS